MILIHRYLPISKDAIFSYNKERYHLPIILMLSGKIGSGKTFVARSLKRVCDNLDINAEIFHFAEGVKKIAEEIWWDNKKDKDGRFLLQTIGHYGRKYSNGLKWAEETHMRIQNFMQQSILEFAIIDDLRYPEEILYIAGQYENVFTARIIGNTPEDVREKTEADFHPSETSLDNWPLWNFIIWNRHSTYLDGLSKNLLEHIFNMVEFAGGKNV